MKKENFGVTLYRLRTDGDNKNNSDVPRPTITNSSKKINVAVPCPVPTPIHPKEERNNAYVAHSFYHTHRH
jgi:hypothetical protein